MELQEFAIMVDSIEKALNSFYLVTCLLGCGIFRDNLNDSKLCFSIFYILTVWSAYACTFCYVVIIFTPNSIFVGFLMLFVMTINLSTTIISITITVRKHEKFLMCIRNLSLVDDTLEQLGIPKEYYKMRKSLKWILIIWFIIICITWATDGYWAIKKFKVIKAVIIPFILHYPFHINTLMDIMFIFLLSCIGTRFNEINDYIGQLSETKNYGLKYTWKKSHVTRYCVQSAENREHILWTAMHLHLALCRIARNLNSLFGMQVTLQMISYFVCLIGLLYFQYHIIICFKKTHKDSLEIELIILIHTNVWCGFYLIKLVTLNYICESVGTKAKKTKNMIHKLTNLVYFNQIRKDICQFVLQISHQPLKFNGMGLFNFGYKFIREFIVGIVGIMLFMVQMDTSPLSRMLISNNGTCSE